MAALCIRSLAARLVRPLLPTSRAATEPRAFSTVLLGALGAVAPRGLGRALLPGPQPALGFKNKAVLRKRCKDCYAVKRRGRWFIYCKSNPRHKQRQL